MHEFQIWEIRVACPIWVPKQNIYRMEELIILHHGNFAILHKRAKEYAQGTGCQNVTIIVRNSMAYPQTLKKKILVARVVAAYQVPEPQMWPGMTDALDEAQGIQMQKLTTEQR